MATVTRRRAPRNIVPAPRAAIAAEDAAVRRAWITLAAQSALAVAATLALLGGLAFAVVRYEQRTFVAAELARAVANGDRDDVEDLPTGTSVLLIGAHGAVLASSWGTPPGLPDPAGLRAVPDHPVRGTYGASGTTFATYTVARNAGWVQGVFDLGPQQAERQRLLGAALVAGVAGILLAGGVGALLGRRAVKPLGDALTRQRRFVADASHELRTPLTLLRTRAQLLARDAAAGRLDAVPAETAAIGLDAERLGEVIDDLLVSAELGGGRAQRVVVNLGELVAEVADAARADAEAGGVAIETDICDGTVAGTPTTLRRVVASLLDNAIHHAGRGGHVTLGVRHGEDGVLVEISDDGDGFDPAQADRLFERFARANGPGRGRRYGLGLALVREVVIAHGGHVEAESRPGAGATFRVVLPSSG